MTEKEFKNKFPLVYKRYESYPKDNLPFSNFFTERIIWRGTKEGHTFWKHIDNYIKNLKISSSIKEAKEICPHLFF